jgi:drug/metabolite transporter (DMT)-like permease
MIGGWMILHEPVTIWLFIGAALISLGVYLSEKFGRMKLVEHDA